MKTSCFLLKMFFTFITFFGIAIFISFPDNEVQAQEDPPAQIENGDFETGDLTGWAITEGDAFCEEAVTNESTFFSDPERPFNQQGAYHLRADKCGADGLTGKMRSNDFTLSGSGYISFLLGNGANPEETYLRVVRASDDTPLEGSATGNEKFIDIEYSNNYQRYYMDLSDHIGEVLYIELVDADSDGWGMLNVDDVVTYYEDPPSLDVDTPSELAYYEHDDEPDWNQYVNEYSPHYRDLEKDGTTYDDLTYTIDDSDVDMTTAGTYTLTITFDYNNQVSGLTTYTETRDIPIEVKPISNSVVNGGFETGDLTGWNATGEAFCESGVTSDSTYWDQNYPFNQEGSYHFHGAYCGEAPTGTLTSSRFNLEGSGYISMLLGAAPDTEDIYVEVIDDETGDVIDTIANTKYHDSPDDADSKDFNNNYVRYYLDLSDHVGKRLYLKVTDNDTEGWAFINIDDVNTYYEKTPELTTGHEFPDGVLLDEAKPDFPSLVTLAPTYADATVSVNETVDTSVRDTYTVEYTVDYEGLSTTKTADLKVHRELLDVSVTTHFDTDNEVENIMNDIEYGTAVSFDNALESSSDYDFAFWIVDGNVRKDLPLDHAFTVNDALTLDAVFSPNPNHTEGLQHVAVFMDTNEALIEVQHILDGQDASEVTSTLPSKPGYQVSAEPWDRALSGITEDTVFILQYEKTIDESYSLTVNGGTGDGTYDYNDVVTVTPDSSNFSYWKVDGETVSHEREYSFTLLEDTTIEAVYDDGSQAGTPFITMSDDLNLPDRESYRSYLAQFHLPDNVALVEYGIITNDETGEITLDSEGVNRYKSSKYNGDTGEYLMSLPEASSTTARAYLTYEANGELITIYSTQS